MFFKILNGIKDDEGNYIGGYCTLCDSQYIHTGKKNHCEQIKIEYFGKILFIDKEKTYGKFKSKTRGYFKYDLTTDTFSKLDFNDKQIINKENTENNVSTIFGDGYLLLELLKESSLFNVLKENFSKKSDFERVFIHLLHSVGKCGQDIDCCDYARRSFLSYLIPDIGITSLESDTAYYKAMADPNLKLQFFKSFIKEMRKHNKNFGKVCYLDSTPVSNQVKDMVLNYFYSQEINTEANQVRLALILDEETNYPVWFEIIPGNLQDSLIDMYDFITEELELEIENLVLDWGYCTEDNLLQFKSGKLCNFLIKMPDRKEYDMETMYRKHFKDFIQAGYAFVRNGHSYYGRGVEKELFGEKFWAYVYVDKTNALTAFTKFQEEHECEYENMKDKDKNKKEFAGGFFVLLSPYTEENKNRTPKEALNEYFKNTEIETFFKINKTYVEMLPICKESSDAIIGKIFSDVISTIFKIIIRENMSEKQKKIGISKFIAQLQSLMCTYKNSKDLTIAIPNKQETEVMKDFGIKIPSHLNLEEYKKSLLENGV